jgi:hypothetical protein
VDPVAGVDGQHFVAAGRQARELDGLVELGPAAHPDPVGLDFERPNALLKFRKLEILNQN